VTSSAITLAYTTDTVLSKAKLSVQAPTIAPVLHLHRSERADALVAALGELLRDPTGDVFARETVAVPSRGVERWLAQRLSHVLGAVDGDGVCANVEFPSYTRLLDDEVAAGHDGYAESVELWAPERAVWPLLEVIDACVPTEPWCRVLATHLGTDAGTDHPGRRFAVAAKLAMLFDRYGRSRPALVQAWRAGRDEQGDGTALPDDLRWQAELWRRLREHLAVPAPAEVLDDACRAVTAGPDFSVFGATRIAPARIAMLRALAGHRQVHLWVHHPSPALWQAVAGEQPGPRRAQSAPVAHPLLASMSRDVRELQHLLAAVPHDDLHHPIAPRPDTLLGHLQDDLANDRLRASADLVDIAPGDRSVQVHLAHGPARQVEALREAVLGLLAADPTLEPRDIVIMCPDIEQFAPLIAASFGMVDEPGSHPAAGLRVRLADRALHQINPLLGLLAQLLELAAGRLTATQLLDLAGIAPVRRRFGFDDDDVERLRTWTVEANARWGLDGAHREQYGLRAIEQGTWRAAIDRMLLGVAMEDAGAWVATTVPIDDVDSAAIDLAGRFAELLDRVDNAVRVLGQRRPARAWAGLLEELVRSLGEGDQPWQAIQLRRELDDVAEAAEAAGTDRDQGVELGLADLGVLLGDRLAGRPSRASFRTGTLTVCTLVPMRSVPHRVVCLLGMDDGSFPRQSIADGDDVLAREPRSGERDVRSEDRQLFLDAVCAAEEHLVIAYTGADPRSGADVPPCVPLGELLDALDATGRAPGGGRAREHVVVRHPLQPFDARNFRPGALGTPAPFSFDPSGLAGARAAAAPRVAPAPLVGATLPPPQHEHVVGLDDLVRFLQHPAKGFLRQRLDIAVSTRDEDPADALPVELEGLAGWAVGDRLLAACLRGTSRQDAAQLEFLRGALPPGPLGRTEIRRIGGKVDAVLAACAEERAVEARAIDIAVPLLDGRVLAGTVAQVRGDTLLSVVYSRLAAKHRLSSWVRLLAAVAAKGDSGLRAVTVGGDGNGAARSVLAGVTPALARHLLDLLVGLRDLGLCEPVPLALETSHIYAKGRRSMSSANAMAKAQHKWEADRFRPEREEPEHELVYGTAAPFDRLTHAPATAEFAWPDEPTLFGSVARRVWDPLVTTETTS
jgi:exodeoxyribonuclease V gamma subunit